MVEAFLDGQLVPSGLGLQHVVAGSAHGPNCRLSGIPKVRQRYSKQTSVTMYMQNICAVLFNKPGGVQLSMPCAAGHT